MTGFVYDIGFILISFYFFFYIYIINFVLWINIILWKDKTKLFLIKKNSTLANYLIMFLFYSIDTSNLISRMKELKRIIGRLGKDIIDE